jgi:hypothetical protein
VSEPETTEEVWRLIERADELVKYAPNRDPAAARAQARAVLERALAAARRVPGATGLERLAARRLEDLASGEAAGETG